MYVELILLVFYMQTYQAFDFGGDDYRPRNFANCYETLGCIEVTDEWYHETYRPVNLEPLERHVIRTEFILIKKAPQASDLVYDILTTKQETVTISGFKKESKIVMLIHDFTSNGYTGWIKHMASVIQAKKDYNVISIDWEGGAEPPYDQAIANARVVALEAIVFIGMLKNGFQVKEEQFHLIGHGIGAHIAGYIGKNFTKIGRITGLDPNGPRFQHMSHKVRLSNRDAKFVEVIHTDAYSDKSQGIKDPLGHADFYLNNAGFQPNCKECGEVTKLTDVDRDTMKEGRIMPGCSHKRAFKYFIESVDNAECKFLGIKCQNYNDFMEGKCHTCEIKDGSSTCAEISLESPSAMENGSYYVNTRGDPPFCMQSYKISIMLTARGVPKEGKFEMIMVSDDNQVSNISAIDSNMNLRTFNPGQPYSFIFYSSPPQIVHVKEAKLKWTHISSISCFLFCDTSIYVDKISVSPLSMSNVSVISNLCPIKQRNKIISGSYITFVKCGANTNYLTGKNVPHFAEVTPPDYFGDSNNGTNTTEEAAVQDE